MWLITFPQVQAAAVEQPRHECEQSGVITADSGDESVAGCDSCSSGPDADLAAASELQQTRPLNNPRCYQVCTDRCSLDKAHTH